MVYNSIVRGTKHVSYLPILMFSIIYPWLSVRRTDMHEIPRKLEPVIQSSRAAFQ